MGCYNYDFDYSIYHTADGDEEDCELHEELARLLRQEVVKVKLDKERKRSR